MTEKQLEEYQNRFEVICSKKDHTVDDYSEFVSLKSQINTDIRIIEGCLESKVFTEEGRVSILPILENLRALYTEVLKVKLYIS